MVWAEVFSEDGDEVELCVMMGEETGGVCEIGVCGCDEYEI